MTHCENVLAELAFRCHAMSNDVLYVESPFAYGFDGQLIGGYMIRKHGDQVKITDNADLMFQAMVNGVAPHKATAQKVRRIVERQGLELSPEGEIFAFAKEADIPALMARLFEASIRSVDVLGAAITKDVSKFEKVVSKRLRIVYGRRVRANHQETGASGHQLRFPLAILAQDGCASALIQTISSFDGVPHWASVYNTAGKMLDLKQANADVQRFSVIEPANSESLAQAKKVLSQSTTVLLFSPELELPLLAA
ncbi:MAG: DUF1828 domain-containing protein [Pseudomonadota bacterium]